MSLSGALLASTSGLRAAQMQSEATSRNIANASTEGYVRKELPQVTAAGGLVQTGEARREVDASLNRMYRQHSSVMSREQAIYEAVGEYTATLGQPGDGLSPADRLTDLRTSMIALVNNPGSNAAQNGVASAAQEMATSLNQSSDMLSRIGGEVDMEIKYDVSDLNETLHKITSLNKQISGAQPGSLGAADLSDQMDVLVEGASKLMDMQVRRSVDGRATLYTAGGTPLVDGDQASYISYDQVAGRLFAGKTDITPEATDARGFQNGSLAGLFAVKTDILPRFQLQLDEMARGLVQGFEGADASLAPGQAGLFTDAGAAYDPAKLEGLAGRISINAAVDPSQGGQLSRLRDGIGATTPGAAGDSTQVEAFVSVFDQPLSAASGTGLEASLSLRDYGSSMISAQEFEGTRAQERFAAARTAAETVNGTRQGIQGVNIDDEMQKLITIQQSYAANSKMMTAVMKMMDTLLAAV